MLKPSKLINYVPVWHNQETDVRMRDVFRSGTFFYRLCILVAPGVLMVLLIVNTITVSNQPTATTSVAGGRFYNVEYVEENLFTLDQRDPQLISYARTKYLTPPSRLPYKISPEKHPIDKTEFGEWVASFFRNKTNGKFVQAGVYEEEKSLHTMVLETKLKWSGLLIECNPKMTATLKGYHRKVWIADVCLSTSTTPGVVQFVWNQDSSHEDTTNSTNTTDLLESSKSSESESFEVQTVPLFTLLAALGWFEVDYFSFDGEGMELAVLKQFPFKSVIFKVLIIETYFYTKEERVELHTLLRSNRYILKKSTASEKYYIHDSVADLGNLL